MKLVTQGESLVKMASKPSYISSKIINEQLVSVNKTKEILRLDKPAYVGFCVLDIS